MKVEKLRLTIKEERNLQRMRLLNLSLNPQYETLLELIGFEWDENNDVMSLNPKKLIYLIQTDKLEDYDTHDGPEGVLGRFVKHGKLGLDDAVRFVMYFGVPKDPDKYKWNELGYEQKTRLVKELIEDAMEVKGIKKFERLIN